MHRLRQLLGKNGASIPKHYHHLPSFLFAAEIYYLYIRVKNVDPVPDLGLYFLSGINVLKFISIVIILIFLFLFLQLRLYLSKIPTYNCHFNSHFFQLSKSRNGNSFLRSGNFSKKNTYLSSLFYSPEKFLDITNPTTYTLL